jgi:hypothetical protein
MDVNIYHEDVLQFSYIHVVFAIDWSGCASNDISWMSRARFLAERLAVLRLDIRYTLT